MNTTILAVPFTGLGLYSGFRGNSWLHNRIKVFEQFVVPSMLNQTDRDFLVCIFWRPEERTNKYVIALEKRLSEIPNFRFKFIYSGILMYDDKYPDDVARERLANSLHLALEHMLDITHDSEWIYWLLQPSDDCYHKETVRSVKEAFKNPETEAVSFTKGYLCNYTTKELLEYNPETNPPFAAIKYSRGTFFDPAKHLKYVSLKEDAGKYKAGTPLPSHEYLPKCLKTDFFEGRGFLVGTHLSNISTTFDHPYGGTPVKDREQILDQFGIATAEVFKPPISIRSKIFHALPYGVKRKLRYWGGDCKWPLRPLFSWFYHFIRG